jgi:hypothetical protein
LVLKNEDSCGGLLLCSDGLIAIKFELGELPADIFIENATLRLNLVSGNTNGLSVGVSPATTEWGESLTGRPSCDVDNEVSVPVALTPGEYSWDITEMVRVQYNNPTHSSGLCLRLSGVGQRSFTSREGPGASRPRLDVTFMP